MRGHPRASLKGETKGLKHKTTILCAFASVIALAVILSVFIFTAEDEEVSAADDPKEGNCGGDGNVKWIYSPDNSTLRIWLVSESGGKWMTDYGMVYAPDRAPWVRYGYAIKVVELPEGLETIGNIAFDGCNTITTVRITGTDTTGVTFPNSIRAINHSAFQNCSSLTGEMRLSNQLTTIGTKAFYGCANLSGSLVIPDSVTDIGDQAFFQAYTKSADDLVIGEGITEIKDRQFWKCKGFKGNLSFGSNVKIIGVKAFEGCSGFSSLTLGPNIEEIKEGAFLDCPGFKGDLTFPSTVKVIRINAFRHDSGFDGKLTFEPGSQLTTIEETAFHGCSGFTGDLTLPNSITGIGPKAFAECGFTGKLTVSKSQGNVNTECFMKCGFTDVNLGSVTHINSKAFAQCPNLKTLALPSTIKKVDTYAFNGCSSLAGDLVFPSGLAEIKDYAFANCQNIISLTIPATVTEIGGHAFYQCMGVKSLNIALEGSQLTKIGDFAFADCSNIVGTVNFPNSLTTIGINAFQGCSKITGALALEGITALGKNAFAECVNILTVVVGDCAGMDENAFPSHTFYRSDNTVVKPSDGDFKNKVYSGMTSSEMREMATPYTICRVTYDTNGGKIPAPIQGDVVVGTTIKISSYSGTVTGKIFGGWSYNDMVYMPDTNLVTNEATIVLTAVWNDPPKYKVTYQLDGGSGEPPVQDPVTTKEPFFLAEYDGEKEGFYFEGWRLKDRIYQPGMKIIMGDSDITIWAVWSDKPVYHVVYITDGGSGDQPPTGAYTEGETVTFEDYSGTKEGYVYKGWIYEGVLYQPGKDTIVMPAKTIAVLADWRATHKVTYKLGGGEGDVPIQSDVAEGDEFTVQACTATRTGYMFTGWMYQYNYYNEGDQVTMKYDDIDLVAQWEMGYPYHSVTYDLGGGSGEAPTQDDVQEHSKFTVKMYSGTKDGYSFGGWEYNGKTYQMGEKVEMGTSNITLVAVWNANKTFWEQNGVGLIVGGILTVAAAAGVVFFIMRRY